MARRITPRFALGFLTALVMCLQFFGPTTPHVSAQSVSTAEPPATYTSVPAAGGEANRKDDGENDADAQRQHGACGTVGHDTGPHGLLDSHNRHHTGAVSSHHVPPRSLLIRPLATDHPAAALSVTGYARGASRSSTAHSPASLQVFRC